MAGFCLESRVLFHITCYLKAAALLLTALERQVSQQLTRLFLIYISSKQLSRYITESVINGLFLHSLYRVNSAR